MTLKHLDLFSGIGGFSLGLESTGGFETVGFCEIDKFCQKVLAKHWPKIPIFADVKENDFEQYRGKTDIITGGYPCQPFSVAGKQKGEEDPRHLWPRMREIIAQVRPTWIVCENVHGHIKMGLDTVLLDLENIGYTTRTFIIPACSVNAPHRRNRVFIIATSMADTYNERLQRSSAKSLPEFTNLQIEFARGDTVASIKPYSDEPRIYGTCDGVPNRVDRLKSLGNAVVPHIVAEIGKAILYAEKIKRKTV